MEVALVSAATGVLKSILVKLADLLGDKYKRLKEVRGEIKFLMDELDAMHAFLLKMSEEEDPDEQDKAWMTAVRELSYDMEDAIDDFIQRVDDKDTKPDGFMEKIKHSLGKLGKMKTHSRIANEIGELKKQILEVSDRNERYKTRQAYANSRNVNVDPRALAIFENASNLTGIDEPKAEIIKLLTEDNGSASQEQLMVVSIVGLGGMGKTTLANQVYQDLKDKFECQAFLTVSRNPDMINILRTILSQVSNQRYADTEEGSVQQLIVNITDFLQDKRYFIVVDDIWDVKSWAVIKLAFPMAKSGSKIITTTRMKDVADSCRSSFSGYIYNMRPLDIVHSRQLFYGRLFKSKQDCPAYLEEVSEQILEKCGGLPLAILAISALLANKERTEHIWNQVKDSIGRALERNPSVEGMIRILSLSYIDLPPHLKTCVLYLSTIPEDSIVETKNLIRRWIAEGFIQKEGNYTVYEIGERCFNELINRCLIQPEKLNKQEKVKTFRVHDTVLDFIIAKSIEENFVTLVGVPSITVGTQRTVRRLSLQGNSFIPTNMVLSHVRSLNVFGDSIEIPSLDKFNHLRILHFECYNHDIDSVRRLFQLRYLKARLAEVNRLPEQIGHLQCLEVLDLRNSDACKLPASIINLRKLVHLLVDSDAEFPHAIAKMHGLETLKRVGVFRQPLNFQQELGKLQNLRKLVIDFEAGTPTGNKPEIDDECQKAIASSLRNLGNQNLCSLTIWSGKSFLQQEGPMPLNLRKLCTYWSPLLQVPKWVSSLVHLQQLCLQLEKVGQEDLCTLGGLAELLILYLEGRGRAKDRLRVNGGVGFRCLSKFCYKMPNSGMELMFAAGSMPKLEKLEIEFDAHETKYYEFGIENLPSLIVFRCGVRGYDMTPVIGTARAAMKRAAAAHPNHPALLFI